MSHPTIEVLHDVAAERARQDAKWGAQRDIPNICHHLAYEILPADFYKQAEKLRAAVGHSTWTDILLEEVAEAVDEAKAGDIAALRKELIQVAAVAVCWVEGLDQ